MAVTYQFGEFELDAARYELRRQGRVLKLERIPMDLLILLAEKNGDVVTRQEIIERLWGKDVFVDTEHGINTAIRKIRTVLREDAEKPRFIQTVTGKGYRLAGGSSSDARASVEPAPEQSSPVPSMLPAPRHHFPLVAALFALCLAAGSVLALNARSIRDRWFRPAVPHIQSIAVLPLSNLSGDPSQDYFADGMTDELITMLAKSTSLRVVSRTSAMQYKGVQRPVRDIAQELGVDGVLEGSISRSADRVHMNVQLIYAPGDRHIWAESYDRDLNQAYSLPQELSQTVAKEVKAATSPAPAPRYVNPEAHDAYLRGRYLWLNRNSKEGQKYLQKAIELQPDYALAWSGLADAYAQAPIYNTAPSQPLMDKSEAAARKAVDLDDSLSEAHNSLAAVYYYSKWDWKRADAEVQRAIALDPNLADAHHLRSNILFTMNRVDEALQEQKRATELDQFERPWALGSAYLKARQYDAAIHEMQMRANVDAQDVGVHFVLARAYFFKGMGNEAAQEYAVCDRIEMGEKAVADSHAAFLRGGMTGVSEWWLKRQQERARREYVSPVEMAMAHVALGHKEEALRFLEAAYREHSPTLVFLENDPIFDPLHSDPHFQDIAKRVGLPPGVLTDH